MRTNRLLVTIVSVAGLTALLGSISAQTSGKPSDDAAERRSPLPNYFGKIAVSDEQRESLYSVQDEYGGKIDALQKQIKMLLAERDAKMEALLTPGQKLRLTELRAEAKQRVLERANEQRGSDDKEAADTPN